MHDMAAMRKDACASVRSQARKGAALASPVAAAGSLGGGSTDGLPTLAASSTLRTACDIQQRVRRGAAKTIGARHSQEPPFRLHRTTHLRALEENVRPGRWEGR
jgi:hypothetical protein